MTRPSSQTPRPPALCPPLRIETRRFRIARAKLTAATTSAASAQRAINAGANNQSYRYRPCAPPRSSSPAESALHAATLAVRLARRGRAFSLRSVIASLLVSRTVGGLIEQSGSAPDLEPRHKDNEGEGAFHRGPHGGYQAARMEKMAKRTEIVKRRR